MKYPVKPPAVAHLSEFVLGGAEFLVLSVPSAQASLAGALTAAETAVAMLALQGLSNRQIAEIRGAAVRTVANQLAAIYRKLVVGSRVELAAHWAQRRGEVRK